MIGVFDIGVGGLSVVKEILRNLPGYRIIYLGDIGRLPYSSKAAEVRIQYSVQDADFMVKRGAKILVIACNTITAIAGPLICETFKLPTFNVIDAGVKAAVANTKNKRVGIIGSQALIENSPYPNRLIKIDPEIQTISKACQLFVYLVEENYLNRPETYAIAKEYLKEINAFNIDTLILGCTHFPFMRNEIQSAMGDRVTLIDPAAEIVRQISLFLKDHPGIAGELTRDEKHSFYISGGSIDNFKAIGNRFLGIDLQSVERIYWD